MSNRLVSGRGSPLSVTYICNSPEVVHFGTKASSQNGIWIKLLSELITAIISKYKIIIKSAIHSTHFIISLRFTWGSRLRSSCIAELKQGSRDVLVAGGAGSAAPDPWEGRGQQQQPLQAGQVEQG